MIVAYVNKIFKRVLDFFSKNAYNKLSLKERGLFFLAFFQEKRRKEGENWKKKKTF